MVATYQGDHRWYDGVVLATVVMVGFQGRSEPSIGVEYTM